MKPIKRLILDNVNNAQDCNWYRVYDTEISSLVWYNVYNELAHIRVQNSELTHIQFGIK